MKVSVLVSTYNQDKYVAQAIDSVLMQEVGFDCEIVIGEDASTDRTRQIVLGFQKRYPDRIRVLLRDAVDAERDRAVGLGGKANFVQSLQACQGQYVALLDGDDYWTDVHKLQKQVDFLDTHPDFAICCHNVTVFYEDGSKEPANLIPPDHREVSTIEDLFFVNSIPTCSTVFRRGLFGELPDWFFSLAIGDWPMHIMNAQHGKIRYINEVMAAYRVHGQGVWSSRNPITRELEVIKMLDHIDCYLGYKYRKQVRAAKAGCYHQAAQIAYAQGDLALGRKLLARYFWYSGFQGRRNLLSLLLRRRAPTIYRSLRMLRDFARSGTTPRSGTAS
jgi:glycosyltransferase involved in cell wall biosynthesis